MTNDKQIALLVTILAEGFRQKVSDLTLKAYCIALRDVPIEAIKAAVEQALKQSRYMPTAADLREMAGELRPDDRAMLAWQAVLACEHNCYSHVDFDDPVINAVIRTLGGWPRFLERLKPDEEKWTRKEFVDAYVRFMRTGVGDVGRPLPGLAQAGMLRSGVMWTPNIRKIKTGLPPHTQLPQLPGSSPQTPALQEIRPTLQRP